MIPGLPQELLQGSDEEGSLRMKRMIYITDSMTAAELDSDGSMFMEWGKDGKPTSLTWRVTRVAKGSGTSVKEVEELLCQYRMMANMAKQAGGKNGWYAHLTTFDKQYNSPPHRLQTMQKIQSVAGSKGLGANGMPTPAQIQAIQVCIPYLAMNGLANIIFQRSMPPGMLQQMRKQMQGGGGMQEMMKAMMGQGGGDGPDMEEMQSTFSSFASSLTQC